LRAGTLERLEGFGAEVNFAVGKFLKVKLAGLKPAIDLPR
jgi:hypothetical protein